MKLFYVSLIALFAYMDAASAYTLAVTIAEIPPFTVECHNRFDDPKVPWYLKVSWNGISLFQYRMADKDTKPNFSLKPQRMALAPEKLADGSIAKNYLFSDDKIGLWYALRLDPDKQGKFLLTYSVGQSITTQNGQFVKSAQTYAYSNCTVKN